MMVGHQVSVLHVGLDQFTQVGAAIDGIPQHLSSGYMEHTELPDQELGLRSLATAGSTHQNEA